MFYTFLRIPLFLTFLRIPLFLTFLTFCTFLNFLHICEIYIGNNLGLREGWETGVRVNVVNSVRLPPAPGPCFGIKLIKVAEKSRNEQLQTRAGINLNTP